MISSEVYTNYKPADYFFTRRSHVAGLVESGSLSFYAPPDCKYQPQDANRLSRLSSAQLDAFGLICEQHEKVTNNLRHGFLLGDGTGVGKSAIISGVICENMFCERQRAIWVTVDSTNCSYASNELRKMGYTGRIVSSPLKVDNKEAVLITTYNALATRITSIVTEFIDNQNIFDGVIVFDECHKAKNAKTKTGKAVNEIQEKLPNARVLYASATAASDIECLHYATRLHLWGKGQPFADFTEFRNYIREKGVNAMEVLAMDLRANGLFIARTLDFANSVYTTLPISPTNDQIILYNTCCDIWQYIYTKYHDKDDSIEDGNENSPNFNSNFWGCHLTFFQELLSSFKVHKTLEIVQHARQGVSPLSVVIGLQSTGESAYNCQSTEHDGLISKAKDVLMRFVKTAFKSRPESMQDIVTFFEKKKLELPPTTIDFLIDGLEEKGIKFAELTGRTHRCAKNGDKVATRKRKREDEVEEFQSGKKHVAIISDAASTGISLHASRDATNQQRRFHIMIEWPWSAEKTLQQLGRTNRTNQVQAPHYMIMYTTVPGEMRYIAQISSRLKKLGAMTQGNQNAWKNIKLQHFDYFNSYGEEALGKLLVELPADLQKGLSQVGIEVHKKCNTARFFNRLLGIHINLQHLIYQRFVVAYNEIVRLAKLQNTFEEGIDVCEYGDSYVLEKNRYDITCQSGIKTVELVKLIAFRENSFEAVVQKVTENNGQFFCAPTRFANRECVYALVNGFLFRPTFELQRVTGTIVDSCRKVFYEEAKAIWLSQLAFLREHCLHEYRTGSCGYKKCSYGRSSHVVSLLTGSIFSVKIALNIKLKLVGCTCGNKRYTGIRILQDQYSRTMNQLIQLSQPKNKSVEQIQ